jgi:hypothetical protein
MATRDNHGTSHPESRRKRPGLAKRCRLRPPLGPPLEGVLKVVDESTGPSIDPIAPPLKLCGLL